MRRTRKRAILKQKNNLAEADSDKYLTKKNVLSCLKKFVVGKEPNFNTMIDISAYMDFAIFTKDLALINAIHNEIITYFFKAFPNKYRDLYESEFPE